MPSCHTQRILANHLRACHPEPLQRRDVRLVAYLCRSRDRETKAGQVLGPLTHRHVERRHRFQRLAKIVQSQVRVQLTRDDSPCSSFHCLANNDDSLPWKVVTPTSATGGSSGQPEDQRATVVGIPWAWSSVSIVENSVNCHDTYLRTEEIGAT